MDGAIVYTVVRNRDGLFLTNTTTGSFGKRGRIFKSKKYAMWLAKRHSSTVSRYHLHWEDILNDQGY